MMIECLDKLNTEMARLRQVKTELLETMSCHCTDDAYTDEIEDLFYEVDDYLANAKYTLDELMNKIVEGE